LLTGQRREIPSGLHLLQQGFGLLRASFLLLGCGRRLDADQDVAGAKRLGLLKLLGVLVVEGLDVAVGHRDLG